MIGFSARSTANPTATKKAITLNAPDFARGSLRLTSYARPGKLFTGHSGLVANQVGELLPGKFSAVRDAVVRMIQKG